MRYGKTRKDVICIVESAAHSRGVLRSSHVTDGRCNASQTCHCDRETVLPMCVEVVNKDMIDHYFSLLHDTLTIHNLLANHHKYIT